MTTLLFGAHSMLGWSMFRANRQVIAFDNRIKLDDERAVVALFAAEQPALVVHCAGVCDVATCEQSPAFAHTVNVEGTRLLLAHAPASTRIVYLSSDHVFGGDTGGPYDEDSAPAPISVYGRTRVAAEHLVLARPNTLVIRAGLWIGPSSNGRIGHLDWLRDRHRRGLPMTIVRDEHRSAVWAEAAAHRAWALARGTACGIRHIIADRIVSRVELATFLVETLAIGARFAVESRADRAVRLRAAGRAAPHLGNVALATKYRDPLAAPLPSVVPRD